LEGREWQVESEKTAHEEAGLVNTDIMFNCIKPEILS